MTCIIGLVHKGTVYMGGDSAGVSEYFINSRVDPKVFIKDNMLFGFTDSFRMGQILQTLFEVPKPPAHGPYYTYMCTTFIKSLISCFETNKYISYDKHRAAGGTFLVGYDGELFTIESDFQVAVNQKPYCTCGSGREFAMGAMYALSRYNIEPETKIKLALDATSEFCTTVCKPYTILSL